jgi:hypothetical protein
MTNPFAHPADLMVPPLLDFHLEPSVLDSLTQDLGPDSHHPFLILSNPFAEEPQVGRLGNPLDFHLVKLRNVKPWMKERLRQGAIIRQEHQPFRVKIQPSYRVEAGESGRKEI